eukprot:SAG22_NODE_16590_length_320_cov_0.766816_1_plen_73_part_01
MYEEVIAGYTAKYGADHVETLQTKMNLGALYAEQKDYENAKPLFESVIAGYTAKYGADHVDTLRAKMNLGALY